jgi:hypothetical protein
MVNTIDDNEKFLAFVPGTENRVESLTVQTGIPFDRRARPPHPANRIGNFVKFRPAIPSHYRQHIIVRAQVKQCPLSATSSCE